MIRVFCLKEARTKPSHIFAEWSTFDAFLLVLVLLSLTVPSTGFQPRAEGVLSTLFCRCGESVVRSPLFFSSDDWASFQSLDDDDDIVYGKTLDKQEYAEENDPQDVKEAVGALRAAPIIEVDAEPILVPAGK